MTCTIVVATHKPYRMPPDPCYLPLHVGKAGKEEMGFAGDDTGENISRKNPYYCELTGLYWLWKNVHTDYKGLVAADPDPGRAGEAVGAGRYSSAPKAELLY